MKHVFSSFTTYFHHIYSWKYNGNMWVHNSHIFLLEIHRKYGAYFHHIAIIFPMEIWGCAPSVNVIMALNLSDLGSWVIRSTPTSSHGPWGTSSGRVKAWGCWACFFQVQTSHPSTYLLIYALMEGHQNCCSTSSSVACIPGCPAAGSSWHCCTTSRLRSSVFGT